MAFITSSIRPFSLSTISASKTTAIVGRRPVTFAAKRVSSAAQVNNTGIRMDTSWEGSYPPSDVLGLGKDVPSFLFLLGSVIALILGSYSVYMSNIFNHLSAETVNPQFIVGSLLVPISWGLHVAGWIQKENSK